MLSDVTNEQKYMNASFREWIVIMNLGTLVGVHGDRAVAVAWMWPGFAGLARRSSQEGEAVDDDCGMVVFRVAYRCVDHTEDANRWRILATMSYSALNIIH